MLIHAVNMNFSRKSKVIVSYRWSRFGDLAGLLKFRIRLLWMGIRFAPKSLPCTSSRCVQTKYNLFLDAVFMICVGSVASVFGFGYTYLQAKRSEINEITSKSTPQVSV